MKPRLRASRAAIVLIERFEGYRRTAAQLADGRWTIGYGHTKTAREGAEVSEADAEALLLYDLMEITAAVNDWTFTPLSQNQFDALVAFAFNVGLENFRRSSVLRRVNEGAMVQAACALEMWRKADLQGERIVVDALVRRRAAEKYLFLSPADGWVAAPSPILRPRVDYDVAASMPKASTEVSVALTGPRGEAPRVETQPAASRAAAEALAARLANLMPQSPADSGLAEAEAGIDLEPPPPPPPEDEPEPPLASEPAPRAPPPPTFRRPEETFRAAAAADLPPPPVIVVAPPRSEAAPAAPAHTIAAPPIPPEFFAIPTPKAPQAFFLTSPPESPREPPRAPPPEPTPAPAPAPAPAFAAPPAAVQMEEPASPKLFDDAPFDIPSHIANADLSRRIVRREPALESDLPAFEGAPKLGGLPMVVLALLGLAVFSAAIVWGFNAKGGDGLFGHPMLIAWGLGLVGIACVASAVYFLLERLGGKGD